MARDTPDSGAYAAATPDGGTGNSAADSGNRTLANDTLDFPTMLAKWQRRPDYALLTDMSVRGDRAVRRALYDAAREWLPSARAHQVGFLRFARERGVRGSKIENVLAKVLFGRALPVQRQHDYAAVMRHWFARPDAPLAEAEAVTLDEIQRGVKRYGGPQRDYICTPANVWRWAEACAGCPLPFDPFPRDWDGEIDGRTIPWHGGVRCNSPYTGGGSLNAAAKKAIKEVVAGRATVVAFLGPLDPYLSILFAAMQRGEITVSVHIPPEMEGVPREGRIAWEHVTTGEPMKGPPNSALFLIRPPAK